MEVPLSWSVTGARVVVTGATSGLGRVTALELAGKGATVVLASRAPHKLAELADEIRGRGGTAETVVMDLSSIQSVEEAGETILEGGPVKVLVNNAGVVGRGSTREGLELNFGVNFVGPFHLTNLLREGITGGRVVNVSSDAHFRARGIDWDSVHRPTKSVTGFPEYAQSKLAMAAWSRELARRWTDVDVYCVHPGVVATDIWRRLPQPFRWLAQRGMLTPEEGALTQLMCAIEPELAGRTGLYWSNRRPRDPSPLVLDDEFAREVWERTVGLIDRLH